jgi:phosphinothricin acetyltransferase
MTADAAAITGIYNEGIEDRTATFETELRTERDVLAWLEQETHPVVVVEDGGRVIAFAMTSPSSARACYARNAHFSVYVARDARGRGAGRVAMTALLDAAKSVGFVKLLSGVFPANTASRALLAKLGFREVGVQEKHGQLDGAWKDVVLVERRLLP